MLSALRKAGQVKFGSVILSTNASLINNSQCSTLLNENVPNLRIVNSTFMMPNDPRAKNEVYLQERLANARFFDIDKIADTSLNLPHMLPSISEWADHMQRLNIGVNDVVICYDDHSILGSSRAWWTFKTFGIKNCWILNTNLAKWKNQGLPVESGEPKWQKNEAIRPKEDFNFSLNSQLVKNMKDIKRWVESSQKNYELVDARSPGRFAGTEPDPRGLVSGHIPGSKNLFFKNLLTEDMCFKSDEELAQQISKSGIDLNKEVWFTCGSGVTAAVDYAAFYQVGLHKTSLYDGSWSEWASDKENPVGVIKGTQ